MTSRGLKLMRNTAAAVMCLSGLAHIAQLWLGDIDGRALVAAVFGGAYLLIGIGLYGVSRFTLFLATLVPACGALLALHHTPLTAMDPIGLAQVVGSLVVMALCATVLYQVRDNPSV